MDINSTSTTDDKKFGEFVHNFISEVLIGDSQLTKLLEESIEWMNKNLDAEQLCDKDKMVAWVGDDKDPEDVFDFDDLEKWALENGFVKDED